MIVSRISNPHCCANRTLLDIKSVLKGCHSSRSYTNRNLLSLKERGLISALFPDSPTKFTNLCNGQAQTVYAGFDPTANSLHVGHLAVINMLLHCQRAGHRVIALIGGATGMIGDPTGRHTERPDLESSIVNDNCTKISENIQRIFNNHEKYIWDSKHGKESLPALKIVNNRDWYSKISSLDLIGNFGRHFRVKQMLGKTSVQTRMEVAGDALSFKEFSYQIFQGYDWYHLHTTHNCNIQIGGHDQMGNMTSGYELVTRVLNKTVYGITVPLVKSEMGNKYGKTAKNAVWLDPAHTSPFDMYQFLVRTPDADVEKFLYTFTFLTKDEIEAIMRKHTEKPEKRGAQTRLAKDVTLLVHGEDGLNSAIRITEALYSENIESLASLTPEQMSEVFKTGGKSVGMSHLMLESGTTILDMAIRAGCFTNKADAIRTIEAGGFYLNYQRVNNLDEMIVPGVHILPNNMSLARVGKKHYYVINWA